MGFGRGSEDEVLKFHDYFKFKVSYITDKQKDLLIIFVTGLSDSFDYIKKELKKCKKDFLNLFGDILEQECDAKTFNVFDPSVDAMHRNLKPKISLCGFSGVGKTTTTRLIKAEEIPMQHVPTITGDIATIKIGKLQFSLWDFAGQEQFSYLWTNFVKGSDAILLITDSTIENVEKSKFFLELIKEQAPNAHTAVIANKQDLEGAMPPTQIEKVIGLKAYSMIANREENREKMIQIIADVLEMNADVSPLLKPLRERDQIMEKAKNALELGNLQDAAELFERISDFCIEMGDDTLGKEFFEKASKIKGMLKTPTTISPEPTEIAKETTTKGSIEEKAQETPSPEEPQIKPSKVEIEDTSGGEEVLNEPGIMLNPEDFMVKETPKQVTSVPKDAKNKLKTSAFGEVKNPTQMEREQRQTEDKSVPIKPPDKSEIASEIALDTEGIVKEESKLEKALEESPETTNAPKESVTVKISDSVQRKELEKTLTDLKIKKANISKMTLDFEMKELMGEITTEEYKEKLEKLKVVEKKINEEIDNIEKML
ncbi:MAG: GTP-binding protein [Candidatus Lokiarchaeota archaeon]|nr:GTP-binding protein [Candidatus Lokiarchaeota archaeon]